MSTIQQEAPAPEQPRSRRGVRGLLIAVASSFAVAAAIVVAVMVLQGDDKRSDTVVTSPPDGATPATAVSSTEQAVRDTVQHFYDARDAASAIPDPDYPPLSAYATGPQLQADIDATRKLQDEGQATQLPPNSIAEIRVQGVSVDGERAKVEVCRISDGMIVAADTRIPAYDYPAGAAATVLQSLDLVREVDGWRVAGLTSIQRWEGVTGCAVGQP